MLHHNWLAYTRQLGHVTRNHLFQSNLACNYNWKDGYCYLSSSCRGVWYISFKWLTIVTASSMIWFRPVLRKATLSPPDNSNCLFNDLSFRPVLYTVSGSSFVCYLLHTKYLLLVWERRHYWMDFFVLLFSRPNQAELFLFVCLFLLTSMEKKLQLIAFAF